MNDPQVKSQFAEMLGVFAQLREYIVQQPDLSELQPVAVELELQAQKLVRGEVRLDSLSSTIPSSVVSRHHGEEIVRIVSSLPPVGRDFDDETKLGLATLLGNLVTGITGAILLNSDLVSRQQQNSTKRPSIGQRSLAPSDSPGFLLFVEVRTEQAPDAYPFSIPAMRCLRDRRLELDSRATILVGENGSGKSTLMEAIAVAASLNAEGGTNNFRFSTRSSESSLHKLVRLARSHRRPRTSFFLRAESFFNVATKIEELDREPAIAPPIIDSYGNRSLHEQSHGESFMALVQHRFGPEGLYILDEPEAALSVQRQIDLVEILSQHTRTGSQLIIATHSPILMALPGASIYELGADGIRQITYVDAEAVRLTREFLERQAID